MESIRTILGNNAFRIPLNQRGYSWRRDHAKALIEDLQLVDTSAHYLGPLICTSTGFLTDDESRDHIKIYVLDDGQQRLTTFLLLIHALLTRFKEVAPDNLTHIGDLERCLVYHHEGKQLRVKNENSILNQYLRAKLLDDPVPDTRTAPMICLDEVYNFLEGTCQDLNQDQLIDWKLRVITQSKFILVDLAQDNIDRYLAFDAINSRGLPLSEFDKIKNFCALIAQRRSGITQKPEQRWYEALVHLERYGASSRKLESTFIAEAHSLFLNKRVGLDAVHREFVVEFRKLLTSDNPELEKKLSSYIEFWPRFAEAFGFIYSPRRKAINEGWCTASAHRFLQFIDQMDLPTIPRPILTSALLQLGRTDFERVCQLCEIYTFRTYALRQRRTDANKIPINTLGHKILRHGYGVNEIARTICKWLEELAPLQQAFSFLSDGGAKYYFDPKMKGWSHCYYFLYQYELSVSPATAEPVSWHTNSEEQKATIEHILPQQHRDEGWWQSHWSSGAEADQFKHRIGNLVLTGGNLTLQRKPIGQKLDDSDGNYCYNCETATNSEKRIRNYTDGADWGPKQILRREVDLIRFAMTRWTMGCCADDGIYQFPEEFGRVLESAIEPITIAEDKCIPSGVPDAEASAALEAEDSPNKATDADSEQDTAEEVTQI